MRYAILRATACVVTKLPYLSDVKNLTVVFIIIIPGTLANNNYLLKAIIWTIILLIL